MNVRHAGVIGAGTMGVGIAYVLAAAGAEVELVEVDEARSRQALERIATLARRGHERGTLDETTAAAVPERVHAVDSVEALPSGLDVLVEAVPEDAGLKQRVLTDAEKRDPTLLATNTSALSIGQLAGNLVRPERFLGLHFFNPVWVLPLVEVVVGPATAAETTEMALAVVAALGKEPVVVHDAPGFASSRLGVALGLEAMRMVEEGVAAPADIDRAMELGYRHPMGPLRLSDLVGLDVRLGIARHLAATLGERFSPPAILERKVAEGELGKKTGRGFYDWPQ